MSTQRILLIEDDATIAFGLQLALKADGYDVRHYLSAEESLRDKEPWALAIVDWMLPGMSGVDLLQLLKQEDPTRPVILLTAKSSSSDIVQGLDKGADDYVTKPFQLTELLARVRARLRTEKTDGSESVPSLIQLEDIEVDLQHQIIRRGVLETHLTTHENAVLQYLIERQGTDVSRQELLEYVWGYAPTMQTRTVDNQILKLRKKMELNPARPRYIITVHGFGYRFVM
jgi:DNA-binding response OmpR family regulator